MSIYREIEYKYASIIKKQRAAAGSPARQDLLDALLAQHPEVTHREKLNIRIYFHAMGDLKGLDTWIETKSVE